MRSLTWTAFFVRLVDTFKFKKMNMMKVAFDITATKDRIYYLNTKANVYARLDTETYNRILKNQVRF